MEFETAPLLPSPVIYLILIVGCLLAVARPYWGFLLGVVLPTAVDNRTMVFSRLSGLGPFFNVYDLCLAICVISAVADCVREKRRFRIPVIVLAVVGALLIGETNSLVLYGYSYEALRSLRWALTLPVMCSLAANLVSSEQRAKALLLTLFAGALLAEFQHVYMVATQLGTLSVGHEKEMRILAFGTAHVEAWLIAGPLIVAGKIQKPWIQILAALLFLVGIVLSQTRSIVVGTVAAALVYYLWFLPGPLADKWRRLRVVAGIAVLGLAVAIPQLGLGGFTRSLSDRMDDVSSDDPSTRSRQLAITVELDDWASGNLAIGNGLGYCFLPEFARGSKGDIAYGHVGYVTYLSQLGLLGFLVYALFFPANVLLGARDAVKHSGLGPSTQYLSALAASLVLFYVFVSLMSGSLLGNDVVLGTLVGCAVANRLRRPEHPALLPYAPAQLEERPV